MMTSSFAFSGQPTLKISAAILTTVLVLIIYCDVTQAASSETAETLKLRRSVPRDLYGFVLVDPRAADDSDRRDDDDDDVTDTKRDGRLFVGRRQTPIFVGKRGYVFDLANKRRKRSLDETAAVPLTSEVASISEPQSFHQTDLILNPSPSFVDFKPANTDTDKVKDSKSAADDKTEYGDDTKRSRMFVGRRGVDEEDVEDSKRSRMFVGRRGTDDGNVDESKRARMFVGRRGVDEDNLDEWKRGRMFVGKRPDNELDSEISPKRSRMFVGKRFEESDEAESDEDKDDSTESEESNFFDETDKRSRLFVGKRASEEDQQELESSKRAPKFVGKRIPKFVGKRIPKFVGKRIPKFVGKRMEDPLDADKKSRMFVGRRSDAMETDDDSANENSINEKRARMFVGRRSSALRKPVKFGKRFENEQEDNVGLAFMATTDEEKRARMFVGRRSDENDSKKRSPKFVGKREDSSAILEEEEDDDEDGSEHDSDDVKRGRMFVGKRPAPGFVGKRRAPGFVGKRPAPGFVGKRPAPGFVGRR